MHEMIYGARILVEVMFPELYDEEVYIVLL